MREAIARKRAFSAVMRCESEPLCMNSERGDRMTPIRDEKITDES
jgi:hypothetical protein